MNAARKTSSANAPEPGGPKLLAVSPQFIMPTAKSSFNVLLKQNDRLVLYTKGGEAFTPEHRQRLLDMGVRQVFVRAEEKGSFEEYMRENLAAILGDESIPVEERARAWKSTSTTLTRDILETKLAAGAKRRFEHLKELINATADFIANPDALKRVAALIQKGFKIYDHSLATMVFTYSVLRTYNELDQSVLFNASLGALLHDLGKSALPEALLEKRSEALTADDRIQLHGHPAAGVAMLAAMPLATETIHCVLFHHERADGSGYPSGLTNEYIPLPAKVVILCNAYDNLTRATPDGPALKPFQALTRIKADRERYDIDAIKRLIMVLSNAEIA